VLEWLLPPAPARAVAFDTLLVGNGGSRALVCHGEVCLLASDFTSSPVFDLSPAALLDQLRTVALAEPLTTQVASMKDGQQLHFVQRTPTVRYPDLITVEAFALQDGGGSVLALYSRSTYGAYDWGVNSTRLARWVATVRSAGKVNEPTISK
jgi:uncharacterized protein (DUF1499 family)